MESLQRLVTASSLSYLSMENQQMSRSAYYETSQLLPLCQVVESGTDSGATIFKSEDDDAIIVACRGSYNVKNFATNLQFQLVDVDDQLLAGDVPSGESPLRIHQGFQKASLGLWKELQPKLSQVLSDRKDVELRFTGHSLGAATALLCGYQYSLDSDDNNPPLSSIVTFGGPRMANSQMAQYMQEQFSSGTSTDTPINLVHSKDPILQQNQALWDALDFGIVGQELVCESDRQKLYAPSVGLQDQGTPLAVNILDHCQYLGTFVGPRLLWV